MLVAVTGGFYTRREEADAMPNTVMDITSVREGTSLYVKVMGVV